MTVKYTSSVWPFGHPLLRAHRANAQTYLKDIYVYGRAKDNDSDVENYPVFLEGARVDVHN